MEIAYLKECLCGAITAYKGDGGEFSMTKETFSKYFSHLEYLIETDKYHHCNHCVNDWGIDLCPCGSGEALGACDEGLAECETNTSIDEILRDYLF